jgi:hypothetical protein
MPNASRSAPASGGLFNLLAVVFLVLACATALCVAVIFVNPGVLSAIGLNAFVPQPLPTPIRLADLLTRAPSANLTPDANNTTPTLNGAGETPSAPAGPTETLPPGVTAFPTFPPTWTPSATPTASEIPPTRTPQPTETATVPPYTATPSETPTPTPTSTRVAFVPTATKTKSPFVYTLKNIQPMANYANTAGCNWMGIAGQVFNQSGQPLNNITIHIEGRGLNANAQTGTASQYGTGYYEIVLDNHPVETTSDYKIQVRNASGQPLSETYTIPTKGDCAKNLTLVNFEQNH